MNNTVSLILRKTQLARWAAEEKAAAMIEAIILLPVLVTMLMGCYDLGQGITTNQNVIGASQIIGDLVTRDRSVDMDTLADMIKAGELAIKPYDTAPFGYDIVSVQFDSTGNPVVLWRVTFNASKNDTAVASSKNLGTANDGLVIVTTEYKYEPFFSHNVIPEIPMKEVAFLHGRKSATVTCSDCPTK